MVAAISDYIPKYPQEGKLKKDDIGDNWDLQLKQNIDLLSNLNKDGIISVGFKAELDKTKAKQNATNMLNQKKLDAVCLNILDKKNNFGSDSNKIELITKSSSTLFDTATKLNISFDILNQLSNQFKD
jgi:phosphopantothenoylcysteine decarboxylase/phosphopantothenate--cysteine ligase